MGKHSLLQTNIAGSVKPKPTCLLHFKFMVSWVEVNMYDVLQACYFDNDYFLKYFLFKNILK